MNTQIKKSGNSKLNIISDIVVLLKKYDVDSLIIETILSDCDNYKTFHKTIKQYMISDDIENMLNVSSLELLAFEYFENYKTSKYLNVIFSMYIDNYTESIIWKNILLKPDYSYYIFRRRKLPYFYMKDANWKRINIETNNEIYNFNNERNIIIKNDNNYISWDVLDFTNNGIINKQVIIIKNLFNLGLSFKALNLFVNNLLCPTTCHIIKNKDLWNMFNPILYNNNIYDALSYACCYAMYILKHEELIINNKINHNHRFVFTLDEASILPDFNKSHIENNPHVMQIIGENNISSSCIFRLVGKRKINDKATFKKRFDLLTGGIFEGINLKELSASITGSILIPCAHISPLEKLFKIKPSDSEFLNYSDSEFLNYSDSEFLNYSEYYYPSYKSLTDEQYKKHTSKKNTPNKRLNYYIKHEQIKYDSADSDQLQFDNSQFVKRDGEIDKVNCETIDEEIKNCESRSDEIKNCKLRSDEIKNCKLRSDEIKNCNTQDKIKNCDTRSKVENCETEKSRSKVEELQTADLSDIDLSITGDIETFIKNTIIIYNAIVKKSKGEVYIEEVETHSSFKFKIYGPGLTRPIDVFRIPYHPIRMIKQFHVNCVKMYYTDELYLLKSCVSTLLSGVSENYNWISCNKIAAQVFFKYIQKGFTIIFKNSEQKILNKYAMENEHLNKIITYLKITPDKMYCSVKYDNVFFRPHLYGGIRTNLKYLTIDKPYTQNKLQISQFNPLTKYGNIKVKNSNKLNEPNYNLLIDCMKQLAS